MTTPKVDPRFPDRPQDPDFWALSEIVNELDDLAETKGWEAAMATVPIAIRSALYMARARAQMAQDLLTAADPTEALAILWMDAFTAGARYGMGHPATIMQVLDESVDGNRRQGN